MAVGTETLKLWGNLKCKTWLNLVLEILWRCDGGIESDNEGTKLEIRFAES